MEKSDPQTRNPKPEPKPAESRSRNSKTDGRNPISVETDNWNPKIEYPTRPDTRLLKPDPKSGKSSNPIIPTEYISSVELNRKNMKIQGILVIIKKS